MKKAIIMTALMLFATVAVISAQEKTPAQNKKVIFSGSWELDVSKSKLNERMRIEAMTMNVSQTDKELKVENTIKREMRVEGGAGGGGFGRGGGFGDGSQAVTYSLEGKETKTEIPGIPSAKLKAKWEKGGKLQLTSSRSFETPMGVMTTTTKETWSLSEDGKTLTVKRETETPRGTQSSELVFTKKA